MKHTTKTLLAVLSACLALTLSCGILAACGDGDDAGGKGTRYSIQAPDASDVFTVTGLPDGAYEGDTVTFGVTLTHPEESILEKVELYGSSIKYRELTADANGKYTFTMPAEPVRLSVSADYYPDNETDNFLSWDTENSKTVEIWQPHFDGDNYYESDDAVLTANVTKKPSGVGYDGLIGYSARMISLDEDVIPAEALGDEPEPVSTTTPVNMTVGLEIHIDRTKIRAGTAKLILIVDNEHKFGDEAVLACTVTVTEPEPLTQVELWAQTVTFDVSAIKDDENTQKISFVFVDLDYQDTMYLRPSYMFDWEDCTVTDGKVTIELPYAVGHRYQVTFHYYMSTQPAYPDVSLVGSPANVTFASDNILTFQADGCSIELKLS